VQALEEKPSAEPREGIIGTSAIFNCSRKEQDTLRVPNNKVNHREIRRDMKNFLEEELETSPYTHCVFDAQIGILEIARKTSLAPTIKGIAARIQQLLSQTKVVASSYTSVEIAPIPDPEDFLRALDSAYLVSRFAATFHGPNPLTLMKRSEAIVRLSSFCEWKKWESTDSR